MSASDDLIAQAAPQSNAHSFLRLQQTAQGYASFRDSQSTGTGHYWTIDGLPWELTLEQIETWNQITQRKWYGAVGNQFFPLFFTDVEEFKRTIEWQARSYRNQQRFAHPRTIDDANPLLFEGTKEQIKHTRMANDLDEIVQTVESATAIIPLAVGGSMLIRSGGKWLLFRNGALHEVDDVGKLALRVGDDTQSLTHRGGIFEVLSEQGISGTTRSAHRAAANRGLLQQLELDAQLNRQLSEILGVPDVVAHMRSGRRALRNPLGTEWHHPIDNSNVMILLRRHVHRHPDLQDILHLGNIGGFGAHYGN